MWGYVDDAGLALDHDGLCFVRGARDQSDAAGFFVFNLRANPLGAGACLAKAAPGEDEPGVPVAIGWELGVAGVQGPEIVQPDGLSSWERQEIGLECFLALGVGKRLHVGGDCRNALDAPEGAEYF